MSTSHAINADRVVEIKSDRASNLDAEAAIKKLGPDSMMWRDFGSYLYQLILPQAFILQSAHPMIDRAVSVDKKYKLDPWGRAKDSLKLLWPVIYSKPQDAIDMGVRLREMHRSIKGTNDKGEKYHALDPEAYAWVHLTGFDATIRMHEYFSEPVSAAKRATMFAEWQQMARMLGIPEKSIPPTEAEYWKEFNRVIDEKLYWSEALDDLMDPLFLFKNYPKPPGSKMPTFLWKAIALPAGIAQNRLIAATLPETARKKLGVSYSKPEQYLFALFAATVRTLYPLVPESKRYIPLAWKAIKDAKAHPEAYVL